MAPIDPCELLRAFRPLLTCNGGIKNSEEVPRLAGLMRRFSKKLVSRCTYCNILLATENDVLESFLTNDGWNIINTWLKDAKNECNDALLTELLKLLDLCPMSVDRLKSNDTAKVVKTLSKWEDENIADKSRSIVNKWMQIIKEGNDLKVIEENAKKKRKKELERQLSDDSNDAKPKKQKVKSDSEVEDMETEVPSATPDAIESAMNRIEKQLCDANDDKKLNINSKPKENGFITSASVNNMRLESRAPTAKIRYGKSRSIGFDDVLPTTSIPNSEKGKINTSTLNTAGDVLLNKTLKVNDTVTNQTNSNSSRVILIEPKPLTANSLNNKVSHTVKESASFVDAIMINSERSQTRKKRRLSGTTGSSSSKQTDDGSSVNRDANLDERAEDDEGTITGDEEENTDEEFPIELTEVEKQIEAELRGKEMTEAVDYNEYNYDGENDYNEMMSTSGENEVAKTDSIRSPSQIKPILCYGRKYGQKKKSVKWVTDDKIKEVRFFELDENERCNVSRTFGEYRLLELKNERQALLNAKQGYPVSPEKAPIEHFAWNCILIDLPDEAVAHERGKQSNERLVQEERQKNILHEFYPLRELAPDFPQEPDAFEALASTYETPVIIPLEDENNPQVCDFSHMALPKPVTGDEPPVRSPSQLTSYSNVAPVMNPGIPMGGVFAPHQMQPFNNSIAPGLAVPPMVYQTLQSPLQPQPAPQQPSYNTSFVASNGPQPHRPPPQFNRRPFNKERRDRPRNERRLCKFFSKNGRCKFTNCNFVHQNPNGNQNSNERSNRNNNRVSHIANNNQAPAAKFDDWNTESSIADNTQPTTTTTSIDWD